MNRFKYAVMGIKALKTGGAVALAALIVSMVPFMTEYPYIFIPLLAGALRSINNFLKHNLGFDIFQLVKTLQNP